MFSLICFCFSFSRAKLLLRKKKFGEQLLSKADGQLENLETIINDLEFAQVEKEVCTMFFSLPNLLLPSTPSKISLSENGISNFGD